MSEQSDVLLYAISTWREISWPSFKRTFDALYIRFRKDVTAASASLLHDRRRTLQALDALGHCEVEFNESGGRIYAAPPLLARLPICGLPQAIFCGARDPQTASRFLESCKPFGKKIMANFEAQDNNLAFVPRRIIIAAESTEIFSSLAEQLHIGFSETPPAWSLLHFSGSLQEYWDSRAWLTAQELNWSRRDFDSASLQFYEPPINASDFRLSCYDDPKRVGLMRHYLWRDGVRAEVDRDWGRYAVLHWHNQNVLAYDAHRMTFVVPSSAPLPRLFARSLALCSGFAPSFVEKSQLAVTSFEQNGFDIFTGVPSDIAEIVAAKLSQKLVEINLKNFKNARTA